jgi:hypothetical protein
MVGFQVNGAGFAEAKKVEGLEFVKMLGSGSGSGFSIWPDFSTYGLLAVWKNEQMARDHFAEHPIQQECRLRAKNWWTVYMRAAHFHGQWDGICPFRATTELDKKKLVAVITRASIATRKLWQFWRYVPRVGRSADGMPGLLFQRE